VDVELEYRRRIKCEVRGNFPMLPGV
jgi:hypothetical protein